MKQKFKLHTLKSIKDESVRKQLSEQFPVNWDMDRIFQKSYQNYLKQSGKKQIPHFVAVKRNFYLRTVVTAACIALTCGTVGMTAFLQKSAPEFKDSSQSETTATMFQPLIAEIPQTTHIQTDTAIIATNPIVSEISTVPPEPETNLFSADSESIPVMTLPESVQPTDPTEPSPPPETTLPVQTTAPPETNSLTLEIDLISPALPQTLPLSTDSIEPAPTISPLTEPIEPTTPAPLTEPIEPTTQAPLTEPPQTIPPEPVTTEPFNGGIMEEPDTTDLNSSGHEPARKGMLNIMGTEYNRSIGYHWGKNVSEQEIFEYQQEELKKLPDWVCTLNLEGYSMTKEEPLFSYLIIDEETGEEFHISHMPYYSKIIDIASNQRIELFAFDGIDTFVIVSPEQTIDGVTDRPCTLVWDTGKSVGILSGMYSHLLDTLRNFVVAFQVN